jgi:hypothetical protein
MTHSAFTLQMTESNSIQAYEQKDALNSVGLSNSSWPNAVETTLYSKI